MAEDRRVLGIDEKAEMLWKHPELRGDRRPRIRSKPPQPVGELLRRRRAVEQGAKEGVHIKRVRCDRLDLDGEVMNLDVPDVRALAYLDLDRVRSTCLRD